MRFLCLVAFLFFSAGASAATTLTLTDQCVGGSCYVTVDGSQYVVWGTEAAVATGNCTSSGCSGTGLVLVGPLAAGVYGCWNTGGGMPGVADPAPGQSKDCYVSQDVAPTPPSTSYMSVETAVAYLLSSWAIGYCFGFTLKNVFSAVSAI